MAVAVSTAAVVMAPGAADAAAAATVCGTPVNPARKCHCTKDYRPVCARLPNGAKRTFANACVAACAGAAVIRCGKC